MRVIDHVRLMRLMPSHDSHAILWFGRAARHGTTAVASISTSARSSSSPLTITTDIAG